MNAIDAARANDEALPETPSINRRRMLLGLAAASTAAAAIAVPAISAMPSPLAPAENPKLIALAAELPAKAKAYHKARRAYDVMFKRWQDATPWAPDELTALGTAWPHDDPKQPGDPEMKLLGGFLWRKGDDFPRRIVITSWETNRRRCDARRAVRAAVRNGNVADRLRADEELQEARRLHKVEETYRKEFGRLNKLAHADHERLYPAKDNALDALERHVAAIMNEEDRTMEGLIIKAQALAEWNRVGKRPIDKIAFRHGGNWYGLIATSILRHAEGGAL